jgi:hypothetical protein
MEPPLSLPSPPPPVQQETQEPPIGDEIDIQLQQANMQRRLAALEQNLELGGVAPYNAAIAKQEQDAGIAKQEAHENREWWSVKDTLKSMGNGANNFTRQLYEFGGGKASKLNWDKDAVGESNTVLGPFISGMTQFMIPFGGLGKANSMRRAASEAKLLKSGKATREKWKMGAGGRVRKWMGVFTEGAVLGGFADFVAFDPREPNAFNAAIELARKNNWDSRMPGFTNILEDWLAHANAGDFEKDVTLYEQLSGRLKNVSEGIIIGGAFNVLLAGLSRNTMAISMGLKHRKLKNIRAEVEAFAGTKPRGAAQKELTNLTKTAEAMELELIQLQDKFLGAGFTTARLRREAQVEADNWEVVRKGGDIPEGEAFDPMPELAVKDVGTGNYRVTVEAEDAYGQPVFSSRTVKASSKEEALRLVEKEGTLRYKASDPWLPSPEGDYDIVIPVEGISDWVKSSEKSGLFSVAELRVAGDSLEGKMLTSSAAVETRKKGINSLKQQLKKLNKDKKKNKHVIAEIKDRILQKTEGLKKLEAEHKSLKVSQEVPESVQKHGGPLREAEFHKKDNAKDRSILVASDGESILMDTQTVLDDFVTNNMAYLNGRFRDRISGKVTVRSQQEKAVLEAMNLDPVKLQAHFINLGGGTKEGGAAAYAKFLELRQRHILKQLKEGKLDLADLNPNNPNHLKVLTSATYDALTLSNAKGGLKLNPKVLADVYGHKVMREALPIDYNKTLTQILRKGPKGEPVGMTEINSVFKRAKKGEITPEEFQSALRKNINLNELGTDSRAALVALTNLFSDSFSKGGTKESRSDMLARSLGWNPAGTKGDIGGLVTPETRTARKFLEDTYKNDINEIADSLGMGADELDRILKGGEGPYSKALQVIPADVELGALTHGNIHDLHYRILAMRLRTTARMGTAQELAANIVKKYEQGVDAKGNYTAWKGDLRAQRLEEMEVAQTIYKMRIDLEALQTARSSWGRQGQAFQNLDKYLNLTDASGKSIYSDEETLKVLDGFVEGLGGSEKISDLAEVVNLAHKMPVHKEGDELGRAIKVSQEVDKAVGAHWLEMVNEVWINAMLSGLRTHAVNNLSNGIKASVSLGQRFMGSYWPNMLTWKSGKLPSEVLNVSAKKGEGQYITIDAGTEAAFQRSATVRQFVYSFSVMKDIFRMLRNTNDDGVLIHGAGDAKGTEALSRQRQLDSKATVENFSAGEMDPATQHKDSKFYEMQGSPLSSASIHETTRRGAGKIIGPAGSRAVNRLADTSIMGTVGDWWDGFYHTVVRMPIRKMVAADQAWKAAHIHGNVVGTLSAYAQGVLKIEDPDLVAEFVMSHKDGIVRRNGDLFSMKTLEKEFQAQADEMGLTGVERGEAKEKYIALNYDLRDADGNLLMAGEVREKLAEQARRDSVDFTFQRDLDQSRVDLANQPAKLRGEEDEFQYGQSISSYVSEAARMNPWLKQFFPFVRTAMNIFQDMGDNFPLINLARNRHKADIYGDSPQVRAAAKARQVTSATMLGSGLVLAQMGVLTGRAPTDPKERVAWDKENKPYAINLGNGRFISYKRIEPYGLIFRWAADAHETWRFLRTPEEAKSWEEASASAIYSATMAVGQDVSYAKNVGEVIGLIEAGLSDPTLNEGRFDRWWQDKLASFKPNILEGFGGSTDDFERELNRAHSSWMAKAYPFGIPHKRDKLFGYVEQKHHWYWNRYVHALTPAKAWKLPESGRVYKEIASHFGAIAAPSHMLKGQLDMTRFFAHIVLDPKKKPSGDKDIDAMNLQIWDRARKMKTKEVRLGSMIGADGQIREGWDYRTKSVPCPVFPGQDAYDYKQQYISVRKEYYDQKTTERDFAVWGLAAEQEFGNTEAGQNAKAWLADVKTHLMDKKALTLEETLEVFINSKDFKSIPSIQKEQGILKEKNFRLDLIRQVYTRWRERAEQELLGVEADAHPLEIFDPKKGDEQFDDLYYNGPLGIFWPTLATSAAKIDRYNHTRKGLKLGDRPLIKMRAARRLEAE